MGKRSNFEKIDKGKYYTWDKRAGQALMPYMYDQYTYHNCLEPCAGSGDLIEQMPWLNWVRASDIEPTAEDIEQKDAFSYTQDDLFGIDYVVTNPDWDRKFLFPFIKHFAPMIHCWLLIDAPWLFNKGSGELIDQYLTDVVPIGRLKWIRDTKMSSKDDCIWARFSYDKTQPARFYGRK